MKRKLKGAAVGPFPENKCLSEGYYISCASCQEEGMKFLPDLFPCVCGKEGVWMGWNS
jgi:hypothetical protein